MRSRSLTVAVLARYHRSCVPFSTGSMISRLLTTIKLITAISLGSAPLMLALPCFSQTLRSTATIVRPRIVRPISSRSTINLGSQIGTARSSNSCYQVDANSKMYVRNKGGGSRYYLNNNSSSYTQAKIVHSRCN
jgi:hypothetical protein